MEALPNEERKSAGSQPNLPCEFQLTRPTDLCLNHRYAVPLALAALACALAAQRWHTYDEPLDRDVTSYAVIAHEMLQGRKLYADLWDHKPPAVHVTFALGEAIAGYGPQSVYALGVAAAAITLFGVYVAASVAGRGAGILAAAFWTLLSADPALQANQPNTEVFINACLVWVFALFVRFGGERPELFRALGIGLLLALSSFYKHVAVVPGALMLVAHGLLPPLRRGVSRRFLWQHAAVIAGVGLVSWALVFDYFGATGRHREFIDAVFRYNRFYVGSTAENLLAAFSPAKLLPDFARFTLPFITLAGMGVVGGLVRGDRRFWALLAAYAFGAHVASALPGYLLAHYYQLWLPPLAVGAGAAAISLGSLLPRFSPTLPRLAGATALGLLAFHELPYYRLPAEKWSRQKYGELFVDSNELAHEIDGLLAPGETFFEWGNESGLYFVTQRKPPTGAFYIWPMIQGPLEESLTARTVDDLKRTEPELIVWNRVFDLEGPVPEWFGKHYRLLPRNSGRPRYQFLVRHGGRLDSKLR